MDRRISRSDRAARFRATIRKGGSRTLLLALTALLALSMFPMGASAQDDWAAPRTVYIPETGHTIDGVFLDTWREWGGATAFGNPITPEIEENGPDRAVLRVRAVRVCAGRSEWPGGAFRRDRPRAEADHGVPLEAVQWCDERRAGRT